MSVPHIYLKPRKAGSALGRHPWLFSGALDKIDGTLKTGAWVKVYSGDENRFIAHGLYNSHSQISVRLYSWNEQDEISQSFFSKRVHDAVQLRLQTLGLKKSDSFRVIYSEADLLSGLIVDKFSDVLVMQFGSAALFNYKDALVEALKKEFSPRAILFKFDSKIKELEGFKEETQLAFGDLANEPLQITENGIIFEVNPWIGQKTGFYFDQRDNRKIVASYAPGKRVLDLYTYTGGFALNCAKAGAEHVVGVDSSQDALLLAQKNSVQNNLSNIQFIESDVLKFVETSIHQKFDLVIADPPKLLSHTGDKDRALRAYFRINKDAMNLTQPGGIFVTCSCSGALSKDEFVGTVASASKKIGRDLQILELRGAAGDHPVLGACPETAYLKTLIARVL